MISNRLHGGFSVGRDLPKHECDLLKSVPLFAGFNDSALETLLAESNIQVQDRGSILFITGDEASHFYVILSGWIKLFRQTPDGHESVIHVFRSGESFAEAAIFNEQRYPVSAEAVDKTRLLAIRAAPFIRHVRETPDYALNIMGSMARHQHHLVTQIEQLSVQSTTQRLARFLLSLCPPGNDAITVSLPIEKALIAGRLGMQPESLSRALAKLRKVGTNCEGAEVHISDRLKLADLACSQS